MPPFVVLIIGQNYKKFQYCKDLWENIKKIATPMKCKELASKPLKVHMDATSKM